MTDHKSQIDVRSLWFLMFLFIIIFSVCSNNASTGPDRSEADPPAVQIGGIGSLVDKHGEVMRGTPMTITGNEQIKDICVPFAIDIDNWEFLRDSLEFNTVRLGLADPYYQQLTQFTYWTLDEALPYIDICVGNAVKTGMNIVINYQSVGEQNDGLNVDFFLCNQYWDVLAPRYADNTLVYYEITNEPTFQERHYKDSTFVANYLALYHKIRELAPNRQILAFSFNSMAFDYESILAHYADHMDWDFTTIAYHMYGNGQPTMHVSTQKIQKLMRSYRVMCTEWDYPGNDWVPDNVDGNWLIAESLENIGSGWLDWRGWGDVTLDEIQNILIPDAKQKGYWWGL